MESIINNKKYLFFIAIFFVLALFLFLNSSVKTQEKNIQPQADLMGKLEPIGQLEQIQINLAENNEIENIFIQKYALKDKSGNIVDLSEIKSTKIKYPDSSDFDEAEIRDSSLVLPVWPSAPSGKYTFRIEHEDGTIREETVHWEGVIFKGATPTLETRTESDGIMSRAYTIEDVDLSSFEEMYYLRPDNAVTRIEVPQDEYFWLKDSDRILGNHVPLIKKEGTWYQSSILIVDKRILEL